MKTNISYGRILPWAVPELEERDAARFNGYNWQTWLSLAREERVDCVAYARLQRLVDMHQNEAQIEEMERRQRMERTKSRSHSTRGR